MGTGYGWSLSPGRVKNFRFQTSSRFHPTSYPVGTGGSFPGGIAAWTWSWPLTSSECQGQGNVDLDILYRYRAKNLIHIEWNKYRPLLVNIPGIIALRTTKVTYEFPQSLQANAAVLLHIRPRSFSSPYFSIHYSSINLSLDTLFLAIVVVKYTIN
jgi:hypothetical protein